MNFCLLFWMTKPILNEVYSYKKDNLLVFPFKGLSKLVHGWIYCDFTSFLTVFQSCLDDNVRLFAVEPGLQYSWKDF